MDVHVIKSTAGAYSDATRASNPSGHIFIDGKECADTVQCVHCQRHWVYRHGSGRKRGWCMNCGGITCGIETCNKCLNWEKKLDMIEKVQP